LAENPREWGGLPEELTIEGAMLREERRGGMVELPEEMVPGEAVRSRLLLVFVGSGALMLGTRVLTRHLDLLANNVPIMIDSNAWNLAEAREALRARLRSCPTRPVVTEQQLVRTCAVALGRFGAKKDPNEGLRLLMGKVGGRSKLEIIGHLLQRHFDRYGCEGAVVVWCAGGGTGTLCGPTIAQVVREAVAAETASVNVMTVPLRTNYMELDNARLGLAKACELNLKPLVVDIEVVARAMGLSPKRLPERSIYGRTTDLVAEMLACMMRALMNRDKTYPSFDFSDAKRVMASATEGTVGLMSHADAGNLGALAKAWRGALERWETLRARPRDKVTALAFLVGADIPLGMRVEFVKWLCRRHRLGERDVLAPLVALKGTYQIWLGVWGLDPATVVPPLVPRR